MFNGGYEGTLDFSFHRDVPSVSPAAGPVGVNEPRFGEPRLVTDTGAWSKVWDANLINGDIVGAGWDHDGTTPLAVLVDVGTQRLFFVRGNDLAIQNIVYWGSNGHDLLRGAVPGYRFQPTHGIVHEGLVVLQTRRDRIVEGGYQAEGLTFVYTQDYGATFYRVPQVGGGYDVPALEGGVADGKLRGSPVAFSNAYPEKGPDDVLGAWFPWVDYLWKTYAPKGGQTGLFRARRPSIGEPWVVEPNVLVYERWEPLDIGGLHAHSAGMLIDGMGSLWGDVDYRNHMVHHIASDLENYTTATWTHNAEFQGGWSPPDNRVYRIGNQGASAAPGQRVGEFLVAGDEQPELVMKVEAPRQADFDRNGVVNGHDLLTLLLGMQNQSEVAHSQGDANRDGRVDRADLGILRNEVGSRATKAVVTSLIGSFPGTTSGCRYTPRLSIWLHYLRDRGYVLRECNVNIPNTTAIHFSVDGETWTSLPSSSSNRAFLYGDQIVSLIGGDLYGYAAPRPDHVQEVSPMILHPGGTNLTATDWTVLDPPAGTNQIRRVEVVGSTLVYADTGTPINPQPKELPPVANGMPIWELSSGVGTNSLGTYRAAGIASTSDDVHWFTAWHYSLNGDGIDPRIQIGSNVPRALGSRWVANNQWVPGNTVAVPSSVADERLQTVRLLSGMDPGPRRWLMAVESFVESPSPVYPMAPGVTGSHELVTVGGFNAGEEWTVGMAFALPQQIGFSSWYDPSGLNTYHPLATVYEDADSYIEVSFARTGPAEGVVAIDGYADGNLLSQVRFEPMFLDALDRAHLIIASSPTEMAATLMSPRYNYGVRSASAAQNGGIRPTEIRLSSADQSTVSPLEWFAVQVHPQVVLSLAEREALAVSVEMVSLLDAGFDAPSIDVGAGFEVPAVSVNTTPRIGLQEAVKRLSYGLGIPEFAEDGRVAAQGASHSGKIARDSGVESGRELFTSVLRNRLKAARARETVVDMALAAESPWTCRLDATQLLEAGHIT